ncbi:hypothetical protein Tco_0265343 [Tanacetum coccineum]
MDSAASCNSSMLKILLHFFGASFLQILRLGFPRVLASSAIMKTEKMSSVWQKADQFVFGFHWCVCPEFVIRDSNVLEIFRALRLFTFLDYRDSNSSRSESTSQAMIPPVGSIFLNGTLMVFRSRTFPNVSSDLDASTVHQSLPQTVATYEIVDGELSCRKYFKPD